jgi:hypothetical protein
VVVEPGATRLEVQFEQLTTQAHVGLYVYKLPAGERLENTTNGASDNTALVYCDSSFKPNKHYALANPLPGRYRIALDPIAVPPGGVAATYRDVIYHPVYGSVEVSPVESSSSGEVKSALTKVTVRARPADGRELGAQVGLFLQGSENAAPVATRAWIVPASSPAP